MHYRQIWEEANGPIPIDENGNTYEIHHVDGDRTNNDLSNLLCVSIKDHYNIHWNQGDFGACTAISRRMKMTVDEKNALRSAISEANRKKVGHLNPFFGKTHSDEWKKKQSKRMGGRGHPFFGKKRPNQSEFMRARMKGRKRTEEHERRRADSWKRSIADRPIRAKIWTIETPDGVQEIKNLKKFCREKGLVYSSFFQGRKQNGFQLMRES